MRDGSANGTFTTAAYDGTTGALVVTGSNFKAVTGMDIDASKLRIKGYTLTTTPDVEITNSTHFTLTLTAADKAGVNAVLANGPNTTAIATAAGWNGTSSVSVPASGTITASNADPTIALGVTGGGTIPEGNESSKTIAVTVSNGTLAASLTGANWTLTNLPAGVTKGTVTRNDDTHATIQLVGNSTTDYDADITNLTVEATGAEFQGIEAGAISANSGVTFAATADAESMALTAVSAPITEGSEDGEHITVALTGGTFVDPLNLANWSMQNLPAGVSMGTVLRTDATHVDVVLVGNTTDDYESNITTVTVTCAKAEYMDNTGAGATLVSSALTLTAVDEDFALASVVDQPQFQINHSNYSPTFAAANANLLKGADGTSNGAVSIEGSNFTYEVTLEGGTSEAGDQINVADNGSGVITITVTDAGTNSSLDGTHTIAVRDTVQSKTHSLTFEVSGTTVSNVTILP